MVVTWKPDDWMVKAIQEGIGSIPDYWGVDLREDGCVVLTSLVVGCQNSVVPLDDPKCFEKIANIFKGKKQGPFPSK